MIDVYNTKLYTYYDEKCINIYYTYWNIPGNCRMKPVVLPKYCHDNLGSVS